MHFSIKIVLVGFLLCSSLFVYHILPFSQYPKTNTNEVIFKNYPNLIDRFGSPNAMRNFDDKLNQKYNPLFDQGSWHGFLLPSKQQDFGSFTGPMIVAEEFSVFIASKLDQLEIVNVGTNKTFNFSAAKSDIISYPGVLIQSYDFEEISVFLELRFVSNRTCLIRTEIKNKASSFLNLKVSYYGNLTNMWTESISIAESLPNWFGTINKTNDDVEFYFGRIRMPSDIMLNGESSYQISRFPKNFSTSVSNDDLSYISQYENINIPKSGQFVIWATHSCFNTLNEKTEESIKISEFLTNGENYFLNSRKNWEEYLSKAVLSSKPLYYNRLIVKSIETLHANWRGSSGQFFHDCVTPSVTSRWFNGIWAWDSWKHAASLSYFNQELAKNNIRAMYDHQIKTNDSVRPNNEGMIIDSIFYNTIPERGGDGHNWNERNGKPPLSVWAVWNIFEQSGDYDFLVEMYPKLIKFHRWWFSHRDFNKNGVVEYGGTTHPAHNDELLRMKYSIITNDTSLMIGCNLTSEKNTYDCVGVERYNEAVDSGNYSEIDAPVKAAASWESGMDNAARFGQIEDDQLKNYADKKYKGDVIRARKDWELKFAENYDLDGTTNGFSINQESVDLNAFMYLEKILLSKIANVLGNFNESRTFLEEATFLKEYINTCMWDEESGFYYDRQIDINNRNKDKNGCSVGNLLTRRGRGTEALIPLWVNISTRDQASKVREKIMNRTEFNGYLPFPSASQTNPAYRRDIYWRGRVWLDQVYFGVIGLNNYGYIDEANFLMEKTLSHAEGLMGNGTFRENYDPESGVMDDATNFGWSAAHIFLLLKEINI